MADLKTCPQCGSPLPPDAPEGLCRACLLKRGLEPNTLPTETLRASSRWTPPLPADLAALFPELDLADLLGRGGMGAVYKARQKNLDRLVALKILPPEIGQDPAFAERFAREAQAMARLNHPNIVTLYEFGQRGDLFFFIMEYVDGMSLRGLLDSGHVSSKEALATVPQICEALQYAHDQGIVHRDIKPENILLNKQGHVKIADFGVAKLMGRSGTESAAAPERVMGTPQYMAPEQTEHPDEVDHRADIYSLGVVFYQMLTGELPVGKFAAPSKRVMVDVRLDEVVLRALEKEPDRRYQQASEVKTQVETIASTPVQAVSSPQPSASQDWMTWSPSQSPIVREICAHMTSDERMDSIWRGALSGLFVAAPVAIPMGVVIVFPNPVGLLVAVVLVVAGAACIPAWRRKQREFLCATAWARQHGISPERLNEAARQEPDRRYEQASEVKTVEETIAGMPGISSTEAPVPPPKATPSRIGDFTLVANIVIACFAFAMIVSPSPPWVTVSIMAFCVLAFVVATVKTGASAAELAAGTKRSTNAWIVVVAALMISGGLLATALRQKSKTDTVAPITTQTAATAPSTPILVGTARTGDLPLYLNGLGTVTALNTVTIHTRVDGQLIKAGFTEGQTVHEGDVLAELDPRPFDVRLVRAQEQLAKDETAMKIAKLDQARYEAAGNAATQQRDAAATTVAQLVGAIKTDQGQIDSANLQLTYCHITAPITGRIGLRLIDVGNIVHASDANGLAVITQLKPIAVVFSLPEDSLPEILKVRQTTPDLVVYAYDRDMKARLASGKLLALDNQIDSLTGTIRLKAVFENKEESLFPNQFVNVRLLLEPHHAVTLVPVSAVFQQPQSKSAVVYVINPNQTVAARPVTLGPTDGQSTEITAGLSPGETIVIQGAEQLHAGEKVDPNRLQFPATQTATASASFGPVIELSPRIIYGNEPPDKSVLTECYINFHTGRLVAMPEDAISGMETNYRTNAAGPKALGDFLQHQTNAYCVYEKGPVLVGHEFRGFAAGPADEASWQKITPGELRKELDAVEKIPSSDRPDHGEMNSHDHFPATFLFRAREGDEGVLQILGYADGRQRMKIRYKLVQQSATQPAMEPNSSPTAAMPTPDYSTPQKAALTYLNAWRFGDWAAMRDGLVAPASVIRRDQARRDAMVAERGLEAAVLERFGLHGRRVSDTFPPVAMWDAAIDAAASGHAFLTEDGDKASCRVNGSYTREPASPGRSAKTRVFTAWVNFAKVDGNWKIVTTKEADAQVERYARAKEQLFARLAEETRAGRYKSFEDAEKAVWEGTPKTIVEIKDGRIAMTINGVTIESESPIRMEQHPVTIKAESVRAPSTTAPAQREAGIVNLENDHGAVRITTGNNVVVTDRFEMEIAIAPQVAIPSDPLDAGLTDEDKRKVDLDNESERTRLTALYGSAEKANAALEKQGSSLEKELLTRRERMVEELLNGPATTVPAVQSAPTPPLKPPLQ